MHNIIMSVDLSTNKIGLAIFNENETGTYVLKRSEQLTLGNSNSLLSEKLYALYESMSLHILSSNPGEIITERPTAFGNGIKVAYAVGVLYAVAAKHGVPIKEISPASVKKEFAGSGRAKKPEMVAKAQELFPSDNIGNKDEDRADAIAIGYTQIKQFYKADVT